MNLSGNPDAKLWVEAWSMIEEELRPLKKTLESQFKKSLSVVPNAQPMNSLEHSTTSQATLPQNN
jgi:hypothetical protein